MPRKKQVRQQNIKYDNQNTKYANQNTKYANQKFTLFCREAIFVANLRTFLAYFFQAKKYGGVPKRTNIRYAALNIKDHLQSRIKVELFVKVAHIVIETLFGARLARKILLQV